MNARASAASRPTILLAAAAAIALSMLYLVGPVLANNKVTICHATSSEGNPFVAITIDEGASLFPHLDDNGNPLAGHEQDFLLNFDGDKDDCLNASNPTPTPTPTATATATAKSSPEGSVEAGTGTPAGSQPDTAMGFGGSNPLPTVAFGLILLASLAALAFANVKGTQSRR